MTFRQRLLTALAGGRPDALRTLDDALSKRGDD